MRYILSTNLNSVSVLGNRTRLRSEAREVCGSVFKMSSNHNNTFDGQDEPVRPTPGGRKRRLDKENHKKQLEKKVRHSGCGSTPTVGCQHTATATCQAEKLSPDDLMMNFNKFYNKPNKVDQDRAILDLLDKMKVNRRRTKIKDVNKRKDRKISVKYSLLCGSHPEKVPVCKASFIKVLGEYNFVFRNV